MKWTKLQNVDTEMMPNVQQDKVLTILEFIYSLHEMPFKLDKSFKARFGTMFLDDTEKTLRRAKKLYRQVSMCICPSDSLCIDEEDVRKFKRLLQTFADEIREFIKFNKELPPGSNVVGKSAVRLVTAWNELVEAVEGQFLLRYGTINAQKLSITNLHIISEIINKVRKTSNSPPTLSIFQDKHVCKFVQACIDVNEARIRWRTLNKAYTTTQRARHSWNPSQF